MIVIILTTFKKPTPDPSKEGSLERTTPVSGGEPGEIHPRHHAGRGAWLTASVSGLPSSIYKKPTPNLSREGSLNALP